MADPYTEEEIWYRREWPEPDALEPRNVDMRYERDRWLATVDALRERAEKAEARTMPTSREQVVTFLHAVAGHDATLSPPTDEMIDGVWALCKHPATTPLTLAVVAYERGRNFAAMKASAEKAERERDEARETNRRLNRRCQRSEALPKFHELGLADELRSAVWHLRHRYRCAARAARSIERMWADNSASHYANLIREWAGKGRPPNHTMSHFDSIVDEMRADKAALAAATSRAEKAEKERDEAATAAKVKADLLATATAALGDATARAERAEAELRKREAGA